jgi:hypothetical protein
MTSCSTVSLIPTCINGVCASNNTCTCFLGYTNDHVLGLFNNCAFPDWAPLLLGIVGISSCAIALLYCAYIYYRIALKGTTMARISRMTLLDSVSLLVAVIAFHANSYMLQPYTMFFLVLPIGLTTHVTGLIVMASLHPIAQLKFSTERVWRYEFIFFYGIPVFSAAVTMAGSIAIAVMFGSDRVVNTSIATCMLALGVLLSVMGPLIFRYTSMLLTEMGGTRRASAAIRTPNSPTNSSFSKVMVKVRRIRLVVCFYCALGSLLFYAYVVLFFVTGTMPYIWVFLLIAVVILSMFLLQAAHFSSPSRARSPSSRPSLGSPAPGRTDLRAGML